MDYLLVMRIKVCKSNFFLTVFNGLGKVLLNINSGFLGFKNIQKRTAEAFNKILSFGVKFLSRFNEKYSIFLKFENIKKWELHKIHKVLIQKLKLTFVGFKVVIKIPHNGCKK
jgi:hypothetical protein